MAWDFSIFSVVYAFSDTISTTSDHCKDNIYIKIYAENEISSLAQNHTLYAHAYV